MKLQLTPERRESIAEALRGFMPELDEPAVQRALFAIWPPRFKGKVCAICKADLATRPVMSEVNSSAYSRARAAAARSLWAEGSMERPDRLDLPAKTVKRNVHKKPLQLVLTARIEGSYGDRKRAEVPAVFFRFCLDCLDQVKP